MDKSKLILIEEKLCLVSFKIHGVALELKSG